MGNKLYVGNLNFDATDGDLESLFSEHGNVVEASVVTDRETGRSRGFAFVTMGSDDEANAAIDAINGQEIGGRALTVNVAKPRASRGGGGGGGGRRY